MRKILTLSLLAVFTALCINQPVSAQQDLMQRLTSPVMRQTEKIQNRIVYRSLWEGSGTNMMIFAFTMDNADFQQAIGVTPEQLDKFKAATRNVGANPEFAAAIADIQKLTNPSDPYFMNASEETVQAYLAANEKMITVMTLLMPQEMEKLVTPEQRQRMQEIQIASMELIPIPCPGMFDALGLTDEQREEMNDIRKELEPEFNRIADELTEAQFAAMDAVYEQMKLDGVTITKFDEMLPKINAAIKKLEEKSGKDYRLTAEKKVDAAKDFIKNFRYKMYDVLTDAQMEKMSQLINNPPKYMETILTKLKKTYETRSEAASWQPGPLSWKPGDSIPEEYIKERKSRFPKKK